MTSENNKRIAKNTGMLYFRMLLTMAVSLYTSRIVLNTLGIEDFGIYNVVGGFVTMFGFLNSAMASATQRFLSFEIGKKDFPQLAKVFNMSVNIHFIIALLILLLAETVGLWFVDTQLTIPAERMIAVKWVYQFSILAFMASIVSVPYNAIIIAHERMNVFAWVSILEVSLKLLIVFILQWFGFDKLKLYAILIFGVALIIRLIYGVYCSRNYKESKFRLFWDKALFKILISYAGWNLWGNAASVIMGQGINILLNIFFGPAINAARGIAYQVNSAIRGFVSNFQMSMNPQIVKSYAADDHKYMQQLIFQGSKYSFFLLFFLSLPVLLQTETILKWWLKTVPDYTVLFCQLILADALINCISGPLMTAAQATGKIKKYQAIVGGLLLFNIPLSYLLLKMGYPPQVTLYVTISLSLIALFARLAILKTLMDFSATDFLQQVIFKILLVVILSIIIPLTTIHFVDQNIFRFFVSCFLSVLSIILTVYFVGLKQQERDFVHVKWMQIIHKVKS